MADPTRDLARVDFDARVAATRVPDTYRTWCEELDDGDLDREIDALNQEGIRLIGNAAEVAAKWMVAKHVRGSRTPKAKTGPKTTGNLSGPPDKLSRAESNRRYEERLVAEHVTKQELTEFAHEGKGWNSAVEKARIRKRESTPAAEEPIEVASDWTSPDGRTQLMVGDFRERLKEIPPGSVDLIVTDPPYPEEFLPLWSDLSFHAARVLGPRGILFGWSGQLYHLDVMNRLDAHLTYGWMWHLDMSSGSQSRVMGRHMIQVWKPILAFTNSTWPSGEWGKDSVVSPAREKTRYEWEQNAAPAQELIERYCPADGVVLDPFMGVGTFGWAAQQAGRRFIGVELDEGRFGESVLRLGGASSPTGKV